LVQSVQARLTQRALTRAYHHWSYHTAVQVKAKARRHHTTQQQGQLARFKARLATMAVQRVARVLVSHWTAWAFHAWRRTTNHDKYHATMLQLSSRHARVHLLTRSLHTWQRNVRTWRTLARMMHTMKHAVMHRRWACWCRHAALHRARRRSLTVVLARYGTANLGLYWRGWCAEFRREQKEQTTRARHTSSALLFWRQHHVRKYVHTWHRHARDAARARQHLRLCLRRMASLALRRCFVQWRTTMKDRQDGRHWLKRLLVAKSKQHQRHTLRHWHRWQLAEKTHMTQLRRALAHVLHRRARHCYSAWQRNAHDQKRLRRLSVKIVARLRHRRVACTWRQWQRSTQVALRRTSSLSRVVRRAWRRQVIIHV
jgi:hypothetical protein